MKVFVRDPEVSYPVAIKKEKTKIVLSWLLEFRFSSFKVLAKRIDQTPANANRFFNSLLEDGFIRVFRNSMIPDTRLVMLTVKGGERLSLMTQIEVKPYTRISTFGRSTKIAHDLAVQEMVMRWLPGVSDVVWDHNIGSLFQVNSYSRPDAMLYSKKGFWWALELERTRKSESRVFFSLHNHILNIKAGNYVGVRYVFNSAAVCEFYQKVFSENVWPILERDGKSGRLKRKGTEFHKGAIDGVNKLFQFDVVEYW